MAVAVTVATGPVASATQSRGRPTLMFRGRRRAAIKKALNILRVIMLQDDRERVMGLANKFIPALVAGAEGTFRNSAFETVINRLAQCMKLQWGGE